MKQSTDNRILLNKYVSCSRYDIVQHLLFLLPELVRYWILSCKTHLLLVFCVEWEVPLLVQLLYGSALSVVSNPSSSLSFVSCIAQGLKYEMGNGTCRIKLWFKAKILPNSWMRMEMSSSSLKQNRRTVTVLQREQGHPAIPFLQKQRPRSVSKLTGSIGLGCERFKKTSEKKELSKEMGEAVFGPEHSHLSACQGRKLEKISAGASHRCVMLQPMHVCCEFKWQQPKSELWDHPHRPANKGWLNCVRREVLCLILAKITLETHRWTELPAMPVPGVSCLCSRRLFMNYSLLLA